MARFESPIKVERAKTPTYNMTQAQIDQIEREAHREGLRAGTYACNAMYSVALLLALRDTFGFGSERLTRAFRAVQKLFDEIAYRDAAQALRDECGINLTIERPKGAPVDALSMFHQMELAKAGYRVKLR